MELDKKLSSRPDSQKIIQGFGHSWMYATYVAAVERDHHWSMLMDMNID